MFNWLLASIKNICDVECFGKSAEYCHKKAVKGRGVRVVGRLKQDSWKDSSGKSQSRVFVIAEHIEYKPVANKSASSSDRTEKEAVVCVEAEKEPVPVEETVF